jgi:hypothetical protein
MALFIDPETRDLSFDDDGMMRLIYGDNSTAQCVRLTLQAWKEEFFLDITHGTEYKRILGRRPSELSKDEANEVLREAIFQEQDVQSVDEMLTDIGSRSVTSAFAATLYSGQIISMEVAT